jgi:hypothetical protein
MYITSAEYNELTGRESSECTSIRLNIACKLLDKRIGNYAIDTNTGWKINTDWQVWDEGLYVDLNANQKEAVKLWVASMISYLADNNDSPPSNANNVRLGRFSVGKGNNSNSNNNTLLPESMGFIDGILVSSGIINLKVKSINGIFRNENIY